MGQQLSNVNSSVIDWMNQNGAIPNSDSILSEDSKENINLFLSVKTFADATVNGAQRHNGSQILSSEELLTKQIQNYLLILTKANDLIEITTKVDQLFLENGFTLVADRYRQAFQDMRVIFDKQCTLQKAMRQKFSDDNNTSQCIFSETCSESSSTQQFSYFAIQLLTSLLLVSIRINEKIDPSISSQIIIVASQLCEQIPIKTLCPCQNSLTSSDRLMFKSLKPLIDYIKELSLLADSILATQALKILLKLSVAQGSFKDLLSIISRMIFNTTDVYNLQHLFRQMNDCLIESSEQLEQGTQSDLDPKQDGITKTILTGKGISFSVIMIPFINSLSLSSFVFRHATIYFLELSEIKWSVSEHRTGQITRTTIQRSIYFIDYSVTH